MGLFRTYISPKGLEYQFKTPEGDCLQEYREGDCTDLPDGVYEATPVEVPRGENIFLVVFKGRILFALPLEEGDLENWSKIVQEWRNYE